MVRTPKLAAEITLQPIRRFGMDAAILFSDILVVLETMGAQVQFAQDGPQIRHLAQTFEDLSFLRSRYSPDFAYMGEALESVCSVLHPHTAVIGFAGAPFTLAAYLICGGPAKGIGALTKLAARDFELYDQIAGWIADIVTELLLLQIQAGADAVQLFDTWSLHLNPQEYRKLALPYSQRVLEGIAKTTVPAILYVRNSANLLSLAAESKCAVISVDSSINLQNAHQILPAHIALQGNYDPQLFHSPSEHICQEVQRTIRDMHGRGYIVNVGQGLTPSTPIEGVSAFVEAVQTTSY
jgi:uroporphyrinogen decarboxylase